VVTALGLNGPGRRISALRSAASTAKHAGDGCQPPALPVPPLLLRRPVLLGTPAGHPQDPRPLVGPPPPPPSSPPSPLRPTPAGTRKKRAIASPATAAVAPDPFAAALAECAKAPRGPSIEELFSRRASSVDRPRRGPASSSISDRLGLFGLHASCKATCAVAESAVHVPRPAIRTGASYGPLNRRPISHRPGPKK
ncbi:unnamed protein product, partial [Musa acuminata subsp. burmannicoides]